MCKKMQVTQDDLLKILDGYHFKRVRLAEKIGLSEASLNVCFNHKPGRADRLRSFTPDAVERINAALPQIADEIRDCVLTFNKDKESRGKAYDTSLRLQINKKIGRYLNITLMVEEVLGWTKKRKEALLGSSSKISGNITEADAQAINRHLLSIYGNLSTLELVADSGSSSSGNSSDSSEA